MPKRSEHTLENLISDLKLLGVRKGSDLIVHASLRSIGKVTGGYRNVLEALLTVAGESGTVLAPSFYFSSLDPAGYSKPPDDEALEVARKKAKAFDKYLTPSEEGAFGDIVRLDYRGDRSDHPVKAWSVAGLRAHEYTINVPLDDADGLKSPIGRVYSRANAQILLLGVDHNKSTSIHTSESLANCLHYHNAVLRYKKKDESWDTFKGCGGCSAGFYKVRGIIDFVKYEIKGRVGNSLCYLIEHKPFVDAVRDALLEKPYALLCDNYYCRECEKARKMYGLPPLKEPEYHIRNPIVHLDD